METITKSWKLTLSTANLLSFAKYLGYQEQVYKREADGSLTLVKGAWVLIPNPETPKAYVERMSDEHFKKFTGEWCDQLVQEQIAINKPTIEEQIKKPIQDNVEIKVVAAVVK